MTDTPVSPAKVVSDALHLLASSLGEFVPTEAQLHLLAAQRELLLAFAAILEHNSSRTPRNPRGRRPAAAKSAGTRTRRPKRVELD